MLFLIQYHRSTGKLITIEGFDDSERMSAENARLEMELALNHRGVEREVVLLEAENMGALHRTHRRYFEDLAELVASPVGSS